MSSKSNLGSSLQELAAAYNAAVEQYGEADAISALGGSFSGLAVHGDYVVIDVIADIGMTDSLLADLTALGLEHGASYGRMVSGLMPISALAEMDGMDGMTLATASIAVSSVGQVTSQGDEAMNSDDARAQFNIDGEGVSIGVLSDSFNNLNGYAADQNSGDLPPGVQILQDLNSASSSFPGSDEGRGMAQLIHDAAPGADLLFHTAFLGQANFAQGIIDLANAGSDIIVDDVIYFSEPMFADGIIAQAVNTVAADGTVYFSSAGNNGDESYEASYRGVRVDPDTITADAQFTDNANSTFHDFDPGAGVDLTQNYILRSGEEFRISFQWDQPYASTSPNSPGSASDYDIWLINARTGEVLDSSTSNSTGADPVEVLSYEHTGGNLLEVAVVIEKWNDQGPDAGLIKFVHFGEGELTEDNGENSNPTSFGHAIAEGSIAVGAAAYFNTPEFGIDPAAVNGFSSLGGVPILFDQNGNRLASPEFREQPAFVAPDGGNTTFFGSDSSADADSFPNFFGTSAAAPHAAAVAALMLEANPDLTPEQIRQILEDTALDMDDPNTPGFDTGYDLATGYGFIDAQAAVAAAVATDGNDNGDPEPGPPDNIVTGTAGDDTLRGTAENDRLEGLGGKDLLLGFEGADELIGDAGNDTLRGHEGDDFLYGGAGTDLFRAGAGDDFLTDPSGNNLLDGEAGDDIIRGGSGEDVLIGRDGNDVLSGGDARDRLAGGDGVDTLTGGEGRDILIGGNGADRFVYLDASDSTGVSSQRDLIQGFRGTTGDRIDLTAIDADPSTAEDDAFTIVGAFTGAAGQLAYFETSNGDIWLVRADLDGDREADLEILVDAPLDMSDSDFLL